ncbi:Uncharacterised protein [Vibrio cholerae]|nr:Uncharacterised protein [Vibrio cholerae]CSI42528.1 Uncharacterised protein [Vibrio cholerae]
MLRSIKRSTKCANAKTNRPPVNRVRLSLRQPCSKPRVLALVMG